MKPSIGRVVHYLSGDGDRPVCLAATITALQPGPDDPDAVSLVVFEPGHVIFVGRVRHREPHACGDCGCQALPEGGWHWPEHVD